MHRRTLLKLGGVAVSGALKNVTMPAQAAPQTAAALFTEPRRDALAALADTVLPALLGAPGRAAAVRRFVSWHVNYREGADMGHGYGNSTLRAKSGPGVWTRYAAQFDALDQSAKAKGAASFAAAAAADRRAIVEAALNTPQAVNRMPARPTGANLVADFMGMYFNSAAAFDLAYQAAIGRDDCRGLEGSDKAPSPLTPGGQ